MLTQARIGRRSLHPLLVAFPLALFIATIGAELAHVVTHNPIFFRAAMIVNIAGVVMALFAALPGAIDLATLTKHDPARATGLKHAALNAITIVLFTLSAVWLFRGWNPAALTDPGYGLNLRNALAIDTVGLVAMAFAGALGWSLVHTHQVGRAARTNPSAYPV